MCKWGLRVDPKINKEEAMNKSSRTIVNTAPHDTTTHSP